MEEIFVHVWPAAEEATHDLEGCGCQCHPEVTQDRGCHPLVVHAQQYPCPTRWNTGWSINGHPANYSSPARCMLCGDEEFIVVVNKMGEALSPLDLEEDQLYECDGCGMFELEVVSARREED